MIIDLLRRVKERVRYAFALLTGKDFVEYHAFPFDTMNRLPPGAEDLMEKCCRILDVLDVGFRLSDGTILGIYREGKFIAHDNDIDVEVLGDEKLKNVTDEFLRQGMTLGRKVLYKGAIQQLVFYSDDQIIFDIVVWHKHDDGKLYNYSERDYERVQDSRFFKLGVLDNIQFNGCSYPMPTPIEEWLEMRYGTDWKIPKTYKGDWKEECFDMSKIT